MRALITLALALLTSCATVLPRFPDDVQTAVVQGDMRVMETARLVLYYPAPRRALAERVAARLEGCVAALEARTAVDNHLTRARYHVVLPEVPFNNAYVFPKALGIEDVAVIPTGDTLDFVTEFGLPPDPGMTGCHELTHYVHVRQIAGAWKWIDTVFGDVGTPQGGFDPWFLEGLATSYEARLVPGVGRPRWPVFTSMFHAAYAGAGPTGGDLSEWKRLATPGHHYLVGTMFVGWLIEAYGEAAVWRLIGAQAESISIVLGVNARFDDVYGKGIDELLAEFRAWSARHFPRRARPAEETVVRRLGTDARWAWAPDGTTAIVDEDLERPSRLVVRDPDGGIRDEVALTEVLPPRALVMSGALLTTGLGFTADGRELYLTALDLGATTQTTRLLRLTVGSGRLVEVARDLGSGGGISPDGRTYYALASDGDRWSVIAYDLASRTRRVVWDAAPGQYALRLAVAPDGARLAVAMWDGARWAIGLLDAATGTRVATYTGATGGAVYDPSFAPDGRLLFLEDVDGRFQVAIAAGLGGRAIVTDAPYGALEPRVVGDRLRFLARDGWRYTLDEVALPTSAPAQLPPGVAAPIDAAPVAPTVDVHADRAYARLDGLFVPRLRVPTGRALGASTAWGVALAGGDRLGYLRWGGAVVIDPETSVVSGDATLVIADLAPWLVVASGERQRYQVQVDETPDGAPILDDEALDRGALSVGRTWRGTAWASASVLAERLRWVDRRRFLVGAQLAGGVAAFESTLYGGLHRGWSLSADATRFEDRDSADDTLDAGPLMVGGAATVVVPVIDRLTLRGDVRARAGVGVDLTIGGPGAALTLWPDGGIEPDAGPPLPGAIPTIETVRGLEQRAFLTRRVAIGELTLRYPLIVDRGITHLWFLPATFLRQLDVETFAAVIRSSDARDLTFGGALTLRLVLFRAPLALRYQWSHQDGTPFTKRDQLWTLGADL